MDTKDKVYYEIIHVSKLICKDRVYEFQWGTKPWHSKDHIEARLDYLNKASEYFKENNGREINNVERAIYLMAETLKYNRSDSFEEYNDNQFIKYLEQAKQLVIDRLERRKSTFQIDSTKLACS